MNCVLRNKQLKTELFGSMRRQCLVMLLLASSLVADDKRPFSPEQEKALGDQLSIQFLKTRSTYHDEKIESYVQRICQRLLAGTSFKGAVMVSLIDSDSVL